MKDSESQPPLPWVLRTFAGIPIERKLTVIVMAATATALAVSAVALVIADSRLFRANLLRDLTALAAITANNSTAALSFDDPQAAEEILSALRARTHVVTACIYRADGRLFARYMRTGGSGSCPSPAASDSIRFADGDMLVSRGILLANRRIGALVVRYDMRETGERIRFYAASVIAILAVSGLLALVLSSGLRRIIATPISDLATTAAAISNTQDYGIRARKHSPDELGVLVDAFNSMLAGIQSRDGKLTQALLAREEALREAQSAHDLLRTTLASIADAVVSTDLDGNIVFANPVACRLLERREEDIVGLGLTKVLRLLDEETGEAAESPVCLVLRKGKPSVSPARLLLAVNGSDEVPIDHSAAPIRNQQGDLVGAVLIFRDITERRHAERELQSAREQLQMVTDTMSPAVTHCRRDLTYAWVSRRYAELLKTTADEIAGRPIREVLGDEAFHVLLPHINRVLAGERVECEAQVLVPRVGRRWIGVAYVPTFRSGEVTGWVEDVTDITDLKDAQAEVARIHADLQRTNRSLARSNEDLGRFAYAASHDLQEPLRMVTTYVQLLVRTLPAELEGEPKQFVQNIVDGAMRMRRLLTDLLAYSEIEGDIEDPVAFVDLNLVIVTVRQNLNLAIAESGAEIACDPLPALTGHAGHFVQLFQNLIGNAIKYRSEVPPRIQISCREEGRHCEFTIADNGIGIAPEYHLKIFGVFKRLHGKKIPGTGIGLAICQRVVERYGGRIWVESQTGAGARFIFALPGELARTQEVPSEYRSQ